MNRFEKWSIWISSALTALTGFGYFWTKYLVHNPDPLAVVNHPLQPWFLKAHIIVSPFLIFALGTVTVKHVWRHIITAVARGRKSGLLAAIVIVPMILTGYLIQAVTGEGWLKALALGHIGFGVLYSFGFALHNIFARRSTATRHQRLTIVRGGDLEGAEIRRTGFRVGERKMKKVRY